jgi:hypothetical protein
MMGIPYGNTMEYFFWDGDRILEYGISSTEMD